MQTFFICPHWGQAHIPLSRFMEKLLEANYDGVEINLTDNNAFTGEFMDELEIVFDKKPDFIFIAQQVLGPANETVKEYIGRMTDTLEFLARLKPHFINSHTGKDHFSFDENCRVIEAAMNISAKTGIRILHETHRGRFSFHAASLIPYLDKIPELELTGDFSHFTTVSESLLQDQEEILNRIIPHVAHIHARVGSEQAAQVNDPFAPEWENHLNIFLNWWQNILLYRRQQGDKYMTATMECGPVPYMPVLPYTQQPVSEQWNINISMKDLLTTFFKASLHK